MSGQFAIKYNYCRLRCGKSGKYDCGDFGCRSANNELQPKPPGNCRECSELYHWHIHCLGVSYGKCHNFGYNFIVLHRIHFSSNIYIYFAASMITKCAMHSAMQFVISIRDGPASLRDQASQYELIHLRRRGWNARRVRIGGVWKLGWLRVMEEAPPYWLLHDKWKVLNVETFVIYRIKNQFFLMFHL